MKKLLVIAIVGLLSLILVSSAFATPPDQANPAAVVTDFVCKGFVPNGYSEDGLPVLATIYTTESHAVGTKSGNQILTCRFIHDVDLQKATIGSGFSCGTYFGITYDTKMVATPGGEATLTCKINGNK